MARIAGLNLQERWSNWNRDPFDSESRQHVSVWMKSKVRTPGDLDGHLGFKLRCPAGHIDNRAVTKHDQLRLTVCPIWE